MKIDKARREIQDKKELDETKLEYAKMLKRKLALQAVMNTVIVRQSKFFYYHAITHVLFLYRKRKKRLNWLLRRRRQQGELRLEKLILYYVKCARENKPMI